MIAATALLLGWLAAATPTDAAVDSPVAVTTRLSPDPSHVGDILTLEITAAFPRGYSVNLPIGVTFAPLHLVDLSEGEPEVTGEGLRKTFTVRLQHFAPGPAQVPSFTLTYVDEAGAVQTAAVPAVPLQVDSLLANEADPQPRPDDPPLSIEYPNTLAETIVYSVLGTLTAAVLAWWALARLRRRRRPAFVPPPIPAHELALEALDELERGSLLADGLVQDYYVELTEIGKGYIERRFGVEALDRTTEEIRRVLVRNPDAIAPLSADEVMAFLHRSDLVKFARMRPEGDAATDDLRWVRDAVARSRIDGMPAPAQPGATPEPGAEARP
ncbi:MAG: hypothetical protein K1X88_16695 [Nannocystaceae bacterium]|nr:hypothetical protein [Nannocystaceae bacterium]